MNFMYTVNVESDEPIMLINRHIGMDEEDGYGIMGDLFQAELLELDQMGKKRIQVWINSVGGTVMDGYNIYNAILKTKTKVDTYCMGIAASIAGVIFQAGRRRIMADYGLLMYHNPFGGDDNKALDAMKDSLVKMVATRSGKPEADVAKMMNRTSWVPASEALADGLCDEIEVSSEQNKKRVVSSDAKARWKEASQVLNSIISNNTISTMKKVANKLGLNPEASEESIVESIVAVQNRATDAEKRADAAEARATAAEEAKNKSQKDLEEEMQKHKDAYEKCKKELDEFKKKAKDSEDAAAAAQAKNMVEGFAKLGKIKNEAATIESWTSQAVTNFEGTKKLLEELPVNKVNNKIDITNSGKNTGYSAVGVMAAVQAKLSVAK